MTFPEFTPLQALIRHAQTRLQGRPIALGQDADLLLITCRRLQHIQRVPTHDPALILVLQGTKLLYPEGEQTLYTPQHAIAMRAGCALDITNLPPAGAPYLALAVAFKPALLERFQRAYPEWSAPQSAPAPQLQRLNQRQPLERIALSLLEQLEGSGSLLHTHLLLELLLRSLLQGGSNLLWHAEPDLGSRLRHWLSSDPAREWRADDLAEQLQIDPSTLRRHLRRQGTSFRQLLEDVRLSHGLSLLQGQHLPVGEVSQRCGYASPSRFAARFRQRFGLPPSQIHP